MINNRDRYIVKTLILLPLIFLLVDLASAESITDETNDWFVGSNGNPITGHDYLDIVSAEIIQLNSTHLLLKITVNDNIPSFGWQGYHWQLDTDKNINTGGNHPFTDNDIGWDYYVEIHGLSGPPYFLHQILPYGTPETIDGEMAGIPIPYEVNGNTISAIICLADIGNPTSFNWIAGTTDGIQVNDKAPNSGHGAYNPTTHPINWIKYSGNPLTDLGSNVHSPSVIFDGFTYKMWYSCESGLGICYATSSNGINWTTFGKVMENGPSNWEGRVSSPNVMFDGKTYKMWYGGYDPSDHSRGRVFYATSSDGINWIKYSGNPVLNVGGNGGWDDWNIYNSKVVFNGTHYLMIYAAQSYMHQYPHGVGLAISIDGINWRKYSPNPVFPAGTSGSWDDLEHSPNTVLFDGTTYHMWYNANRGGLYYTKDRIGYANSTDGINWIRYSNNPVLSHGSPGEWDSEAAANGAVIFDANTNTYKMWYIGKDSLNVLRIGFASSLLADPDPTARRLTTSTSDERNPAIMQDSTDKIWLFYASDTTGNYDIYFKNSIDGGTTWSSEQILVNDPSNEDGVYGVSAFQDLSGKIWVAWAKGTAFNWDIYYKTSIDGGNTWSPSIQFTSYSGDDMSPSIFQDSAGKIWIVWRSWGIGGGDDIWARTSNDGGVTWSSPIAISTDSAREDISFAIADDSGKVWVLWRKEIGGYASGNWNIYMKTSNDNGSTWSSALEMTSESGCEDHPSIIKDSAGKTWLFWDHTPSGNWNDRNISYKSSTDNGATWSGVNQFTFEGSNIEPRMLEDSSGKIWLIWSSDVEGNFDIWSDILDITTIILPAQITAINVSPENPVYKEKYSITLNLNNRNPFAGEYKVVLENNESTICSNIDSDLYTIPPYGTQSYNFECTTNWTWISEDRLGWSGLIKDYTLAIRNIAIDEIMMFFTRQPIGTYLSIMDYLGDWEHEPTKKYFVELDSDSSPNIEFAVDDSNRYIEVNVPNNKKGQLGASVSTGVVSTIYTTIGLPLISTPVGQGLVIAEAIGIIESWIHYQWAYDPDFNYTTVKEPIPLLLPELDTLLEGNAKEFVSKYAEFISLRNATFTAYTRYDGARIDNQPDYMIMQLEAANDYAIQAMQKLNEVEMYYGLLTSSMPPLTDEQIQQIRNEIQANGLPQIEVDILTRFGLAESIDDITEMVLNVNPEIFRNPKNYTMYLNTYADALANESIEYVTEINKIKVDELGYDVTIASDDDIIHLDNLKDEIQAGIDQGIASTVLETQINEMIEKSQNVLVATNNQTYNSYYEFAINSLAIFQTLNDYPIATIILPYEGEEFLSGYSINFDGFGKDPEDGDLTGSSLVWTSTIDGQIGTGESFVRFNLSVGNHTITLTVNDSGNLIDTDEVNLTIFPIPAKIDINPDTLNLKSHGEWITAYIELPEYDVNNISVSTVNLITPSRSAVSVDLNAPAIIGDYDADDEPDLMVKFNRTAVVDNLGLTDIDNNELGTDDEVELAIIGELSDGIAFAGEDTIRVILKGK